MSFTWGCPTKREIIDSVHAKMVNCLLYNHTIKFTLSLAGVRSSLPQGWDHQTQKVSSNYDNLYATTKFACLFGLTSHFLSVSSSPLVSVNTFLTHITLRTSCSRCISNWTPQFCICQSATLAAVLSDFQYPSLFSISVLPLKIIQEKNHECEWTGFRSEM